MKNIAKAESPKSAIPMLPPRPFRVSGNVAHTAFKPDRREDKTCFPTLNHFPDDLGIGKILYF